MGVFELFLGYVHIPAMLILLGLLSFGVGRRQLNKLVLSTCNVHLTINGVRVKLLPLLAIVNIVYLYSMLKRIQNLTENEKLQNGDHESSGAHSMYLQEFYLSYRNALMNICSIVLISQVYVTAGAYEAYKPIKDKADELKKDFYSK